MAPKIADHLHLYKKFNLSRTEKEYLVYRCMKPACSHYIPIILSEGKLCECNRCGEPMIITKVQRSGNNGKPMARPHCLDCFKRKKSNEMETISKFVEGT
jgi:hypothetical protein